MWYLLIYSIVVGMADSDDEVFDPGPQVIGFSSWEGRQRRAGGDDMLTASCDESEEESGTMAERMQQRAAGSQSMPDGRG